jgi:NAD(P)-dependent dehydrogenase (short-subunit alcohol dehydrogenase family)
VIPDDFRLDGKVAIIAGDGQGWQTAMASYLMEAGAVVCIANESADKLEKTGETPGGESLMTLKTNLTDSQEIEDAVNKVMSKWGKLDILVNNMGQWFAKPLLETTSEEWNSIMQTNLTGMFLWSKAVGKHMITAMQGSIINIGSILGERGVANATAFCTSNGGVNQFTKALSLEWAVDNVRVNAIGVGWMQKPGQENNKTEGRLKRYISLGRFCKPEDIAVMLVYLASGASSYVTGQTFYVSGGVMSHG